MTRERNIVYRRGEAHPTRRSLRVALTVWLVLIALVPLFTLGAIGYLRASESRHRDVDETLSLTVENRKAAIQEFFARAERNLENQGRLAANQSFLTALHDDRIASGLDAQAWVRTDRWHQLVAARGQELLRFRNSSPWRDILLIDANGTVLFSCRQDADLGSNLLSGLYSRSRLADAAREARDRQRMVLSPFAAYEPGGGEPAALLVVPVNGNEGQTLGLMAFLIAAGEMGGVLAGRSPSTLEQTVYLVDDELRVLTRPGHGSGLAVLQDRALSKLTRAWLDQANSVSDGRSGPLTPAAAPGDPATYVGPEGNTVFGRCATVHALGHDFGLIAEADRDTALAGLGRIRLTMLIFFAMTALLAVAAGQLILQRIVQPVNALAALMRRVADGHEVDDLHVAGHNEIGDLADQFAVMIGRLNEANASRDEQYELQKAQSELSTQMRGEPDSETLAAAILEHIGEYYGAHVGAFYLSRPGQRLVLAAQVGEDDGDWPVRELREGQGIVGRVASRRRIQVLRNLPLEHMQIRSATGCSAPCTLIVAPFHLAGQIKGVMELGLIGDLTDADLAFLRLSAESVAVALDSARSRERVNRLLEETRRQAGALARQQKELQDSNEQLAHADRCKSEFLANMSHELRTPLNSMMLMSQVLAENRRCSLDEDEVEAAQTINGAARDLMTIIDDILDLSKVEAGRLELAPDHVDLAAMFSELRALFQPVAAGKGLAFSVHAAPDVPATVYTDGLRLRQVIRNLLSNACKFTDTGSVELRVWIPAPAVGAAPDHALIDRVAISVMDTGIGMSDEARSRIFDPFQQADGTIGRRFGGSGLGLSISRRLMMLLQGSLEVESEPGNGSRFTIFLPQTARFAPVEAEVATMAAGEQPAPFEPDKSESLAAEPEFIADLRLVLADDEMRTIYRLGGELSHLGVAPQVFRSPGPLLAAAPGILPGSIVAVNPWCGTGQDGEPDGVALLVKLRGLLPPGVALVALVPPGQEGAAGYAEAVLKKPVDGRALLQTCRRILATQEVGV